VAGQEAGWRGGGTPIMVAELFANGSNIDVAVLLLIIFSLLIGISVQRKTRQKIGDMEKDIVDMKKYQGDVLDNAPEGFP